MHCANIIRLQNNEPDVLLGASLPVNLGGVLNSDIHVRVEPHNSSLESHIVVVLEPDLNLPAVHQSVEKHDWSGDGLFESFSASWAASSSVHDFYKIIN